MCNPAGLFIMTTNKPMNWMVVADIALSFTFLTDVARPSIRGVQPAPTLTGGEAGDPGRVRAQPVQCAKQLECRRRRATHGVVAETAEPRRRRRLPTVCRL